MRLRISPRTLFATRLRGPPSRRQRYRTFLGDTHLRSGACAIVWTAICDCWKNRCPRCVHRRIDRAGPSSPCPAAITPSSFLTLLQLSPGWPQNGYGDIRHSDTIWKLNIHIPLRLLCIRPSAYTLVPYTALRFHETRVWAAGAVRAPDGGYQPYRIRNTEPPSGERDLTFV